MATVVIDEVIHRIDAVIKLAGARPTATVGVEQRDHYQIILKNFEDIKFSLQNGRLPPPSGGAGWGAARGLSEWGLDDEKMFKAIYSAEQLYRDGH